MNLDKKTHKETLQRTYKIWKMQGRWYKILTGSSSINRSSSARASFPRAIYSRKQWMNYLRNLPLRFELIAIKTHYLIDIKLLILLHSYKMKPGSKSFSHFLAFNGRFFNSTKRKLRMANDIPIVLNLFH